jgi:hypothetical protein
MNSGALADSPPAAVPPNVHIGPEEDQMSTGQATSNKATFKRFCDAMSTGDQEVISWTIDELVEPDAQIRTPVPVVGAASGRP